MPLRGAALPQCKEIAASIISGGYPPLCALRSVLCASLRSIPVKIAHTKRWPKGEKAIFLLYILRNSGEHVGGSGHRLHPRLYEQEEPYQRMRLPVFPAAGAASFAPGGEFPSADPPRNVCILDLLLCGFLRYIIFFFHKEHSSVSERMSFIQCIHIVQDYTYSSFLFHRILFFFVSISYTMEQENARDLVKFPLYIFILQKENLIEKSISN